jgi:phosphotransferase system enzyme I (PtsP)
MALIGLGYRTLSMAPASVGPVKTMILGLHVGAVQQLVERFVRDGKGSLRTELMRFAEQNGIEI